MSDWRRDTFRYTPLFCEENIWWLAHDLIARGIDETALEVWFFINQGASVLLFQQGRADAHAPVLWDYHVVLRERSEDTDRVFDFDTRLPFPLASDRYLTATFADQATLAAHYRAQVRQVAAAHYLQHFYSDRSHMHGQVPRSAFPDYPIIQPPPGQPRIALAHYRDVHASGHGLRPPRPVEQLTDEAVQRSQDKA